MSWPGIDYHTHTCRYPLDEMVASALAKGVRELGVSEHIFMLDEGQPIFPHQEEDGERCSRAQYIAAFEEVARTAPLELRLGLEVDFEPGTEAQVAAVLGGVAWDYLIGSVHMIDAYDIFLHQPADPTHAERLWRDYYGLFVRAIESGAFDILSHPVRTAITIPVVPNDFDDLLFGVATVAARCDVALELNGNDAKSWPELVARLARACARAGCLVALGSDAHRPGDIARSLERATAMAAEAGVRGVVAFKGRERRVIPLDGEARMV